MLRRVGFENPAVVGDAMDGIGAEPQAKLVSLVKLYALKTCPLDGSGRLVGLPDDPVHQVQPKTLPERDDQFFDVRRFCRGVRLENVSKGQHDVSAGGQIADNRIDGVAQEVEVLRDRRIAVGAWRP